MLALQFATATANLASQNAFLFPATHGPVSTFLRNGSARLDSGGSAVSGSLWQVESLNVVARVRCELPLAPGLKMPAFKSR